ncbi:unnamed protein product [Adineta ricciae]|uniref:Uncharacterized protein n=1 Tax=Adineta ricciae TaxID=249248 RepID=A0A815UPK8_ADIRI|nr:unnamed protein product [Adineta ricciae]
METINVPSRQQIFHMFHLREEITLFKFAETYNTGTYTYHLFDDNILNKASQSKQLREEAIELLNMMGLKRCRIAYTQLNTESNHQHHSQKMIWPLVQCIWLI